MKATIYTFYGELLEEISASDLQGDEGKRIVHKSARFHEGVRGTQFASFLLSGQPVPLSQGGPAVLPSVPQLTFQHAPLTVLPSSSLLGLVSHVQLLFTTFTDFINVIDMLRALSPAAFPSMRTQLESCVARCVLLFSLHGVDASTADSVALALPKFDLLPPIPCSHPTQAAVLSPLPPIDQRDGKERIQELYCALLLDLRTLPRAYSYFKGALNAYAARWIALDEAEEEKKEDGHNEKQPAATATSAAARPDQATADPSERERDERYERNHGSKTEGDKLNSRAEGEPAVGLKSSASAADPVSRPPHASARGADSMFRPKTPLGNSFDPKHQPLPATFIGPRSPFFNVIQPSFVQSREVVRGDGVITSLMLLVPKADGCMSNDKDFDQHSIYQFYRAQLAMYPDVMCAPV